MEHWSTVYTRSRIAKVSIKDVCKLAGVHPTTVSRWSDEKPPRPQTLARMFATLDTLEAERTTQNG